MPFPATSSAIRSAPNASSAPEQDDDPSIWSIGLGYIGTLVLTLASALAISGFAPDVVTTIAGI